MLVWLEFIAVATAVGIKTNSWLGFVATLIGLFVLLRSAAGFILELALSGVWGVCGYIVGLGTGEPILAWTLAVAFFAISMAIHGESFGWLRRRLQARAARRAAEAACRPSVPVVARRGGVPRRTGRSLPDVIDVEFREV